MADCLVKLKASDVAGAILPLKINEDNSVEDLKRWIYRDQRIYCWEARV
jgi:hypothetical protein